MHSYVPSGNPLVGSLMHEIHHELQHVLLYNIVVTHTSTDYMYIVHVCVILKARYLIGSITCTYALTMLEQALH